MPAAKFNSDTGLAKRKMMSMLKAKLLLLENPGEFTFAEVAEKLGVDRTTAHRYMRELGATADSHGRYTYNITLDDIQLAKLVLSGPD